MPERMNFKSWTLANGVECYHNPIESDYTVVYIQIGRGTAHNTNSFLPGTFHFLEHMCCAQTAEYPDPHSYDRAVGMTGGWTNASTSTLHTTYQLSAPNTVLPVLLPGLFARAFRPQFHEAMIQNQRQVIDNERLRRERWYPGNSEVSWYENTQWMRDMRFPIRQVFGSKEDLNAMSVSGLRAAHAEYFRAPIQLIMVGPGDVSPIIKQIEEVELHPGEADVEFEPISWGKREYHVKHFRDMSRHVLTVGGFMPPLEIVLLRKLRFILQYLTNTTHGVMHQWLRHDLGWSYGLNGGASNDTLHVEWEMSFPVNSIAQINIVRREWMARANDALSDTASIQLEVERLIGASSYWQDSADEIMDSALRSLRHFQRIVTNEEWRQLIRQCDRPIELQTLFSSITDPAVLGTYCAAPEAG
jgi:predicted Zn-dependent peptidase